MEGLTKAFLFIIGVGMLICYLSMIALGDVFPIPQPGVLNRPYDVDVNHDGTEETQQPIDREKALDEREADLNTREEAVANREEEVEAQWALIEQKKVELADERAALGAERQELDGREEELANLQTDLDRKIASLQLQWQEIEAERESLRVERERLNAIAETLTLREVEIQSQEQWLQAETARVQQEAEKFELTKTLVYMLVIALLAGSAIFNIVTYAYFRDKAQGLAPQKKGKNVGKVPRGNGSYRDTEKVRVSSPQFCVRNSYRSSIPNRPSPKIVF